MSAVDLALISRRQHGAFTLAQCGLSRSAAWRRVRSGLWLQAYTGVYRDAAVPRTFEQDAMAACLACGVGAAASHVTAAILLGVELPPPPLPEVTVSGRQPRRDGIRTHRARDMRPGDVARVRGVPATAPMRTVTNLAEVLDVGKLELSLDGLWRRGLVDPERLVAYLSDPRRLSLPGTGLLRTLVRERIGQRPPGSDFETIYVQILKEYRVPLPVRQYRLMTRSGPRRIDLAYPEQRKAVELESLGWHARSKRAFEDGYVRRNDLELLGWQMIGFTWDQCTKDPTYVAITTAEAIGLVPVRWAPR